MYTLCEIIVDVLEVLGIITGLPPSFLGLTVLSWGNSLGDFMASISLSKRGLGEMAMTGCIAGPVFNLMLGLGVTTLLCNIQNGKGLTVNIQGTDGQSTLISLISLLTVTIVLTIFVVINDFKVNKNHAKILMGLYTVSMIVTAIVTF